MWFLIWTIPVLVVLFVLPVQQEIEDRKSMNSGHKRVSLEDRVAVLARSPIGFVVPAASHQRWMRFHTASQTASSTSGLASSMLANCVRAFGTNQTLVANPNLRKSLPRIKHIRILGERNTGTRRLRADLMKAFRNITVESGVTRWGYWFQDEELLNPQEINPSETLVIHVVLEPYEWFARMQTNPIHAPYHRKPLHEANWTSMSFFKRPWICQRPDWDELRPAQGHCQYKFPFDAVVPCVGGKNTGARANKLFPVYEMHPVKHVPFPTIVHLRTAKILNFVNVSTWMPHVVHVRSKDVATLDGVNAVVSALIDRFRLSVACQVHKRDAVKVSTTSVTGIERGRAVLGAVPARTPNEMAGQVHYL